MSELRELYQELIIDHGRKPRNFGVLETANHIKEGFNPLCGDKIIFYIEEQQNRIKNIRFQGEGCAISMASASLLTEVVVGKTIAEFEILFDHFQQLVMGNEQQAAIAELGKLMALGGVAQYPSRVKCATLAWHTTRAALNNVTDTVSTE